MHSTAPAVADSNHRNNLMQRAEFMHSTTLRRTFLVAGIVAAFIGALLGFVYLKTKADLTQRSDRMIAAQIGVFERAVEECGAGEAHGAEIEPGKIPIDHRCARSAATRRRIAVVPVAQLRQQFLGGADFAGLGTRRAGLGAH